MRILVLGLLVLWLVSPVFGDGMAIPETMDPLVFSKLTEDQQLAVIGLNGDKTADLDLFVSITDRSGKSNVLKLILPFSDKPMDFDAKEEKVKEFEAEHTEKLDEFIEDIKAEKEEYRWKMSRNFLICDVPFAPPFFWVSRDIVKPRGKYLGVMLGMPGKMAPGLAPPIPEKVVITEHTRTEVYKVESGKTLEAIIKYVELPEGMVEKVRKYSGDYLYITTVKTVPMAKEKEGFPIVPGPLPPPRVPESDPPGAFGLKLSQLAGLNPLGVHFWTKSKLRKQSNSYSFDYPLGTGEAWANPVKVTRIYVTAPSYLTLKAKFPKWAGVRKVTDKDARLVQAAVVHSRERELFNLANVRDEDKRMVRGIYINSNPAEDLMVFTSSAGFDTLFRLKRSLSRFVYWGSVPIFVVLGLFLWLYLFGLLVGRKINFKYSFKGKRLYGDGLVALLVYVVVNLFISGLLLWPELSPSYFGRSEYLLLTLLTVGWAIVGFLFYISVFKKWKELVNWASKHANIIVVVIFTAGFVLFNPFNLVPWPWFWGVFGFIFSAYVVSAVFRGWKGREARLFWSFLVLVILFMVAYNLLGFGLSQLFKLLA